MIARNRDGACVVVRGRENRPHGEGGQWIRRAGRRRTNVQRCEYGVCPRHAAQAVSVEFRGFRKAIHGSVQSCMRPQNAERGLATALQESGQPDTGYGRRDAAHGRRAPRRRGMFSRSDSGGAPRWNVPPTTGPAAADSEAGQTGTSASAGDSHAQRPPGANGFEAHSGAHFRGEFLSNLLWVSERSKHPRCSGEYPEAVAPDAARTSRVPIRDRGRHQGLFRQCRSPPADESRAQADQRSQDAGAGACVSESGRNDRRNRSQPGGGNAAGRHHLSAAGQHLSCGHR